MGSSCSVDGPVLKPRSKRKFLSRNTVGSSEAVDQRESTGSTLEHVTVTVQPLRRQQPTTSEGEVSSTCVHSVCASHSCGQAQSISMVMPEHVLQECTPENADDVFLKFVCAHLQPMSSSASATRRKGQSPAASSLTSAANSRNRPAVREIFSTTHWATESHSLSSVPCEKVRLPRLSVGGNESCASAATLVEGDKAPDAHEVQFLSEAEEEVHENPLGSL